MESHDLGASEETKPKPKKSRWKGVIITLFLIICIGALISIFTTTFNRLGVRVEVEALKKELAQEKELNRAYFLRRERRKCIAKTIILAYGISEWEAFHYAIIFDQYSIYYQIPWEVYVALIRVETNFNPTLTSKAGCRGLMQIKESTGEPIAKKLDIRWKGKKTLFNEFCNIAIGSFYLSENILKKKNINHGLKCYLGGPDYLKSIRDNAETFTYVKEYKTRVAKEYKQLSYMFRGKVDELSGVDFDEIFNSTKVDTTSLIFDIFAGLDSSVTKHHRKR
jgi:soluble lytic murein transglycosylase-like protein